MTSPYALYQFALNVDDRDAGTYLRLLTFVGREEVETLDAATAAALDLIRAARRRGVPVTCGITPAHWLLSDIAMSDFRTFAHISPPLRAEADRRACLAAIADGTIDVLGSGHDPQGPEAKRLPFADSEPGMAGAESLLALALTLVRDGRVTLDRLRKNLDAVAPRGFRVGVYSAYCVGA